MGRDGARPWRCSGALTLLLFAVPAAAQDASASSPDAATASPPASKSSSTEVAAPGEPTRPVVDPPLDAPPVPAPVVPSPPVMEPPVSASPAPVADPSAAAPRPVDAAAEEHRHSGLFFHADVGGGYLRTTGSTGGSEFIGQGGAIGVGLAIGWAPNEEWALGLEGFAWKALSASGLGPDTSVELEGLGLNVTRYIVPIDLFATVVIAGTRLAITDGGGYLEGAHSDIGFGLRFRLGKEWPVTPGVGLGLAADVFFSVNRNGEQTLHTLGGGLVLTCTGH